MGKQTTLFGWEDPVGSVSHPFNASPRFYDLLVSCLIIIKKLNSWIRKSGLVAVIRRSCFLFLGLKFVQINK